MSCSTGELGHETLNPTIDTVAEVLLHEDLVWGSWARVLGFGFRAEGSGFRVQGSGFRVQGSGLRAHDWWCFWVQDVRSRLWTRKVDVRLPEKGNSMSHGAKPVHQIISMMKWIQTSRLSIHKSLSQGTGCKV